jgi:thiamine biosynthesis lipoprotein
MHTRIDLAFCNLPEATGVELSDAIGKEIGRLDQLLNRFDPSSEIAAVNRHPEKGRGEVSVSDEFFHIIRLCLDYNRATMGYFDVTVNSASHYRDGIRGIALCEAHSTLAFAHPDIRLDLGGFAKGYALDRCRGVVERFCCTDALLSFGNSSVMAIGNHPAGKGWPVSTENDPLQPLTLCDEFLTTSGNGRRATKPHIFSPATGTYIEHRRQVSVRTDSGAWGEALSTAVFAALDDFPASGPPFISFRAPSGTALDSRHTSA